MIPGLSVVIPALNAAAGLPATLAALGDAPAEVVVVDGGSTDGTADLAAQLGAVAVRAPRGRGGEPARGLRGDVPLRPPLRPPGGRAGRPALALRGDVPLHPPRGAGARPPHLAPDQGPDTVAARSPPR